jgi:hypothetical protein
MADTVEGHHHGYDGQLPGKPGDIILATWRASRRPRTRFDGHPTAGMAKAGFHAQEPLRIKVQ